MSPATPAGPFRFVIWTLLIPLGVSSVLFLYEAASRIPVQHGLEYGEGIVLWQAAHISIPREAYHPIERYPFVVFHYPPGFHLMSRLAGAVTGDLLVGGRVVTFAVTLGIMFVLGALVFRSQPYAADPSVRWIAALSAALLPVALPNLRDWVPLMRVDLAGVFLSLLGIWLFIEGGTRTSLRYLAMACFVAALFTKQTLVAAPAAAVIVTLIERPKEAWRLVALAVALGLVPFLAMQYATDGQFATHLFSHNQNSYSLQRAADLVVLNLRQSFPVLMLAAALVWTGRSSSASVASSPNARRTERCLFIYLALAFLMSWTSGKWGAALSYFLEVNLICCALAGLAVMRAFDCLRRPGLTTAIVAASLILAGALPAPELATRALSLDPVATALAERRTVDVNRVIDLARQAPGPVFSWDLMVAMLAKHEIPLEPAIMFELTRSGGYDLSPFLDQVRHGHYALIVASQETDWLIYEPLSEAIASRYALAEQIGGYRLYRPIPR